MCLLDLDDLDHGTEPCIRVTKYHRHHRPFRVSLPGPLRRRHCTPDSPPLSPTTSTNTIVYHSSPLRPSSAANCPSPSRSSYTTITRSRTRIREEESLYPIGRWGRERLEMPGFWDYHHHHHHHHHHDRHQHNQHRHPSLAHREGALVEYIAAKPEPAEEVSWEVRRGPRGRGRVWEEEIEYIPIR